MTTADKLRAEMTANFPMSKERFISIIVEKIKMWGRASFYCGHHIADTDDSSIRPRDEQAAIQYATSEGFRYYTDRNSYGVRMLVFTL